MATLPILNLQDGLHTSPGEAGANHCTVDGSINFHTEDGRLKKRAGMRAVRAVIGASSQPYMAWATGTSAPSVISNTGTLTAGPANNTLYIGHSEPFNRSVVIGACDPSATFPASQQATTVEYWDGTSWVTFSPGRLEAPTRTNNANDVTLIPPFLSYTGSGSGSASDEVQVDLVFDPPTAWAKRTIGLEVTTRYWLRVRSIPLSANRTVAVAKGWVQDTENRILHVNVFRDRRGTKHEFIAYLFGNDGTDLRFMFDGQKQNQSDNLAPDGTSHQFSPTTRVESVYHQATDRIIGHVEGYGWFYVLCAAQDGASAGTVFAFRADPYGTGTPYTAVDGGLRSVIPLASRMIVFDGRIFAADGQRVTWSEPGVYADIWPNANEANLNDGSGNITSLSVAGGQLVVGKRNSIWVGQSDGSGDGYTFYPMPGNVGVVAGACSIGNTVILLAEDGFYQFDGQQNAIKLSGNICGLIDSKEFTSNAAHGKAVYHSPSNSYRFYYPSTAAGGGVMDRALYCDLTSDNGPSWWMQGKYATDDYGFNATAVAADNTTDKNRLLLGDKYGVLWELDVGTRDAGSVVKGKLLSHRIGHGNSQRAVVRWCNPSFGARGSVTWNVGVVPEGHKAGKSTNSFASNTSSAEQVFTESRTLTTARKFADPVDQFTGQGSFGVDCRFFQIELSDTNEGDLRIDVVEVEVNPVGRRGQM